MKEEIAKRITNVRIQMGMSKNQFSKLIGISAQYLCTIERGENCPSIEKVILICEKANISTDYLLLGKINTIDDTTKKMLSEFSEKQIETAYEIVKKITTFIKNSK